MSFAFNKFEIKTKGFLKVRNLRNKRKDNCVQNKRFTQRFTYEYFEYFSQARRVPHKMLKTKENFYYDRGREERQRKIKREKRGRKSSRKSSIGRE